MIARPLEEFPLKSTPAVSKIESGRSSQLIQAFLSKSEAFMRLLASVSSREAITNFASREMRDGYCILHRWILA